MGSGDDLVCATKSRSARPLLIRTWGKGTNALQKSDRGQNAGTRNTKDVGEVSSKAGIRMEQSGKGFHQCIAFDATARPAAGADPGFFLVGVAPLRNGVTDW